MKYILWCYAHGARQPEKRVTRGRYDTLDAAIAASDHRNPEYWRQTGRTTWQLTDAVVADAGLQNSWWSIDYAEAV